MKRIIALAFAVVMLAGSFSAARADGIDVKVQGEWDFAFGWSVNPGFKNSVHNDAARGQQDNFIARQRVRTQINFIASEYLQGVLMFEIGDIDWGNEPDGVKTGRGSGGSLDADGVNVETKRAYLDWIIPYTEVSVRMGIQGLMLPSTPMGTPVLSSDVAGIIVSSPITDWMSASALWLRPFNQYFSDEDSNFDPPIKDGLSDESDIFGLLLPMEFGDIGLNVTPWFLYGFVGANSGIYDYLFTGEYENTVRAKNSRSNVYWIGTHLEFNLLDPLALNLEGIYGHMRRTDLTGLGGFIGDWEEGDLVYSNSIGTSGWFIGATLDYSLDFMTPGIFGWWSSGDRKDAYKTGKLGRLPTISQENDGFAPTTFGTAGTYSIGTDSLVTATGLGTWGIGIQLADISFIEDLSHTLRFAYYRGTNDSDLVKRTDMYMPYASDSLYLTDKDSVFEVNFDHQYQVYENLAAVIELGWIHLDANENTWSRHSGTGWDNTDNAWKAQVMLQYSF